VPLAVCSGTLALIVLDEGLVSLAYVIRDVIGAAVVDASRGMSGT